MRIEKKKGGVLKENLHNLVGVGVKKEGPGFPTLFLIKKTLLL